jgi:beta-glucosidase
MAQQASPSGSEFAQAVDAVRAGQIDSTQAAERLLGQLSDNELLWLLDGDVTRLKIITLPAKIRAGPITGGEIKRLGIPGIRFCDGPRGVVAGPSTSFPVTMARAATWDPALEEQVGLAMGCVARAQGANYSGAVCINLLRHPAWGRSQECYGEDPVLIGQMGSALTRGLRPNVMACVKHFALNSMENARFMVDVQVDDHALHEVYLPHFKAVIDAGAESVMSAYNSVNGAWMDMNAVLLTDVLREEWGFTGFVTSDWVSGTHDAIKSLEAGMDVEMPARLLRARTLPAALKDGRVSRELVLRSARRIVATQIRHMAGRATDEPDRAVLACEAHRALARTVASRAAVLLKNDDVEGKPALPLDPAVLRKIAVIGRLADSANLGDRGSSVVHPPSTCSPLAGLREALPATQIHHHDGGDSVAAAALAAEADVAVLVVGYTAEDEGESIVNDNPDGAAILGPPFSWKPVQWLMKKLSARTMAQFGIGGDRKSLTLRVEDEVLIKAVAAANPRTIVVLIGGSAIIMEAWRNAVPAIVMAWYPGMEGGRAIADVLTGEAEPGGRLPFAIPTDAAHLPFFDAQARSIVYDSWWGQRLLDRDGHKAAFPFGHGLGYTQFAIELAGHAVSEMQGTATVRARNIGPRAGSTVVQVYAVDAAAPRPIPQLIGFARVDAEAGAEAIVSVPLDLTPVRSRDPATKVWSRRPGNWWIVAALASPADCGGGSALFV